jgi:hypothetical protein
MKFFTFRQNPATSVRWSYVIEFFSVGRSERLRQYPMIGFDRKRSDLFRCNPVRNPLVRIPMKFGSGPIGFYMKFVRFWRNSIPDPIISGRIYRPDWITWVVYHKRGVRKWEFEFEFVEYDYNLFSRKVGVLQNLKDCSNINTLWWIDQYFYNVYLQQSKLVRELSFPEKDRLATVLFFFGMSSFSAIGCLHLLFENCKSEHLSSFSNYLSSSFFWFLMFYDIDFFSWSITYRTYLLTKMKWR